MLFRITELVVPHEPIKQKARKPKDKKSNRK